MNFGCPDKTFHLPNNIKSELRDIVGEEQVICLEHACQMYIGFDVTNTFKPTEAQMNKKIKPIRDITKLILEKLNELQTALDNLDEYAKNKIKFELQEFWADNQNFPIIKKSDITINSTEISFLKALNSAASKHYKDNRSIDEPGWFLAGRIVQCCMAAGLRPAPSGNGSNDFHRVLNILRKPLGLNKGTLRRTLNDVLEIAKSMSSKQKIL